MAECGTCCTAKAFRASRPGSRSIQRSRDETWLRLNKRIDQYQGAHLIRVAQGIAQAEVAAQRVTDQDIRRPVGQIGQPILDGGKKRAA